MQTDSHIEVVSPDHYYAYSRHTERIFCNCDALDLLICLQTPTVADELSASTSPVQMFYALAYVKGRSQPPDTERNCSSVQCGSCEHVFSVTIFCLLNYLWAVIGSERQ